MKRVPIVEKNPIRHPVLPDGIIERIKGYRDLLGDLDTVSLEDTIDCFKRDANPEKELAMWERIASTVATYLAHNPTNDPRVRQEVLTVVNGASFGNQDWSGITRLSPPQINHIVLNYGGLNQPTSQS